MNKMLKRNFLILMIISIFSTIFTSISHDRSVVAKAKNIISQTNYIVKCNSEGKKNKLEKKYLKEKRIDYDDKEMLDNNNILSVELSEQEAEELDKTQGILVEEDTNVSGFKKKANCIEPTYSLETINRMNQKKEEYGDNPYEFETYKPSDDIDPKGDVLPWNIECVAGDTRKNEYKGKGVKVAVIDSGIDVHNDIETSQWIDFSEKVSGYKPIDSNGHGTEIAGVIAARKNGIGIIGIANEVELYSVKVLNKDNQATVSSVIKALEWCINNDIDIINMSFGMDQYSKILEEVIKKAYKNGILLVASAGNNNKVQYPAKYKEVVAVGAIDKELKNVDYSADGSGVELVAPGKEVQTTGFVGSYVTTEGTSIAAAHVTGVAAALKSMDLSMDNQTLRELLNTSAVTIENSKLKVVNYSNAVLEYKKSNQKKNGKKPSAENILHYDDIVEAACNEDVVEGSWSMDKWQNETRNNGTGHYSMINNMDLSFFNKNASTYTEQVHNRWIVADAAYRMDYKELHDYDSTRKWYPPYHARTEYSINELTSKYMYFVYELARRRLVLNSQFNLNSSSYNGNTYYGVSIPLKEKRLIIDDMAYLYNNLVNHYGSQINMNRVEHRGYMLLGAFLHMTQDLYCHRANMELYNITTNPDGSIGYGDDAFGETREESHICLYNMTGDNFENYADIIKYIRRHGAIPIVRLKEKLNPSINITLNGKTYYNLSPAQAYEDNPYFFSNRYDASYWASIWMMERLCTDTGNTSSKYVYYSFESWGVKLIEWEKGLTITKWKNNHYN